MRRSTFTETQIIEIRQAVEGGLSVLEEMRKHETSQATCVMWRWKFGGATVAELKRPGELKAENTKPKEVIRRPRAREHCDQGRALAKAAGSPARPRVVMMLVAHRGLHVVRACRLAGRSRAAYYAPPADRVEQDAPVISALSAVAAKRRRCGLWKCCDRLRLNGQPWNWKRAFRVYCALRLDLPRRTKRRLPKRVLPPIDAPALLLYRT